MEGVGEGWGTTGGGRARVEVGRGDWSLGRGGEASCKEEAGEAEGKGQFKMCLETSVGEAKIMSRVGCQYPYAFC